MEEVISEGDNNDITEIVEVTETDRDEIETIEKTDTFSETVNDVEESKTITEETECSISESTTVETESYTEEIGIKDYALLGEQVCSEKFYKTQYIGKQLIFNNIRLYHKEDNVFKILINCKKGEDWSKDYWNKIASEDGSVCLKIFFYAADGTYLVDIGAIIGDMSMSEVTELTINSSASWWDDRIPNGYFRIVIKATGEISSYSNVPSTPVTISKSATATEVLESMDLSNLISDVDLGSSTVYGPTANIADTKFSLFSFDVSATLNLNDKVQAKVDTETKTIQVLVGFDEFDGSAELNKDLNSSNYWTESYAQVKSLYRGVVGEKASTDKLYHGFQKLRGKLRKTDCAIGLKASAEIAGYVEFSYATGEITYMSGGIVMKASLGYEETYHFPPCPAVYVVFGIKADFNGKLKLEKINELGFTPVMEANIGLTATLGTGVGSKKLNTYAEMGLSGIINLGVSIPAMSLEDALTAKLSAQYYFDSKVFGFNGPSYGPKEFVNTQIYPANSQNKIDYSMLGVENCNWSKAEPIKRDYRSVTNNSVKISEKTISDQFLFSKSNLYPYNNVKIVDLCDGTKLLFWIDDNGVKADVNKTTLMYAIYNGTVWSEEKALAETGGANDYPCVYSDGSKAVVVWQKADIMGNSASLPEVLKTVELYAMVYENGKFSELSQVTSKNTTYEMMQTVAMSGDKIAVAWVENPKNDPFQKSSNNVVKIATNESGVWVEEVVASDIGAVKNIELEYVSSELAIAYEIIEDNKSIICFEKGDIKKKYAGWGAQFANGIMYYSNETAIQSYDIITGREVNLGLPAMNDFILVDNGITKAIYSTAYEGYTSELVMFPFDASADKWGNRVTLTDYDKYVRNYDVVLDSDGKFMVALNLVTINEETNKLFGDSTLCVLEQNNYIDLVLTENISYEERLVKPNGKLPICFEVKNNSNQSIEHFTLNILNEEDNVTYSQEIECSLAPGDTAIAQIKYNLPETIVFHKIKLQLQIEDETNVSNNIQEIMVGYADLSIEGLCLSGNRTDAYLEGEIVNYGYDVAKNIKTSFEYIDTDTCFDTVTCNTLNAGERSSFKIKIPKEYMEVNPLANGNVVRIKVTSDTDEQRYGNNEATFLILSEDDMQMEFNTNLMYLKVGEEGLLKVSYCENDISEENIIWKSSDENVAIVTDGKVTALDAGTAIITASANGICAKCEVTVYKTVETDAQAVLLNTSSIKLGVGERYTLIADILPDTAINNGIKWQSKDVSVADVSEDGEVTGVNIGETIIIATAEDGYHFAICQVSVVQNESQTYMISFQGGVGTSGKNPESIINIAGSIVELPNNTYSRTGMIFDGWSDGRKNYKEGALYRMPYHDVMFVAQWKEKEKESEESSEASESSSIEESSFEFESTSELEPESVSESSSEQDSESTNELESESGLEIESEPESSSEQESASQEESSSESESDSSAEEPGESESVLPEDIPTDGIPEGLWIAGIDSNGYLYTGKAIKPEVRVYDNDRRLTVGKDYTITYKNNTKANDASKVKTAPSVVVKGKANYAGTETATFKILPVDLGSVEVFAEDIVVANNGKVQKKVPVLTFNGKKLANKKDFTVSYPSAGQEAYKAAGTYDVLLTAKANGNFTGTRVVKLTVTDSTLISKTSVKKLANQPYTGEAIMPKPKVTYKGKPLSEGTDYTLAYENNTEIGTATVILTGIGAYAGTKKITFKITGPSLKGAKVTVADTVYDGSAQTPKPQIELNGAILREGEDYTVAYQNNIKAGKATITISGIKSYSGTLKKTFQITAYDLGQDTDKALTGWDDILTAKYTKGGTKPELQLQFKGMALIAGEDYTVSYSNNKAVTSATTKKQPTVTIKGKGNFKGSLTKTFVITQKDLDDAEQPVRMMVADVAFKDKAGNYISKPVLTDTDGKALVAGTDYEKEIRYELSDKTPLNEKSKLDIGAVITVTVTGKGAYTGTRTATYCITKSDFSKAKISISPQIYTGKPIVLGEKDITVKIGNNPPLTYGKDYEIVADSYTNNVKKGTASVTVIGKGNYGGMKQVKFKITAKKFSWFWRIFG